MTKTDYEVESAHAALEQFRLFAINRGRDYRIALMAISLIRSAIIIGICVVVALRGDSTVPLRIALLYFLLEASVYLIQVSDSRSQQNKLMSEVGKPSSRAV